MPDTPYAPRPVSGPGESDAEEFMRWLAARGVRVVPPGAVVIDPEGEIPEAVVIDAIGAWLESGPHTVRYERMETVIRAALRAWPQGEK